MRSATRWITALSDPDHIRADFKHIEAGAARAGRKLGNFPAMLLTSACVIKPGESAASPRAIKRVGPFAVVLLHAMWEASAITASSASPFQKQWERYRDEYVAKMKTPADRRYLEVHEGHLIYLKPGEEKYLDDQIIRASTLTGTAEEIIARLRAMEAVGLRQVAIQVISLSAGPRDDRRIQPRGDREILSGRKRSQVAPDVRWPEPLFSHRSTRRWSARSDATSRRRSSAPLRWCSWRPDSRSRAPRRRLRPARLRAAAGNSLARALVKPSVRDQLLLMSVWNGPAMMQLTRTFGPYSCANATVNIFSPALAAE